MNAESVKAKLKNFAVNSKMGFGNNSWLCCYSSLGMRFK